MSRPQNYRRADELLNGLGSRPQWSEPRHSETLSRQALLLRGINLAAVNRVPMQGLRDALDEAGMGPARTYLQSGNVAVKSRLSAARLAQTVETLVADKFDAKAPTVVRSLAQMQTLVDGNPFPKPAVEEPKFYTVVFLSEPLRDSALEHVSGRRGLGDVAAVSESREEVYAWHPGGIHISKLASQLTEKKLGVKIATARNWTTVLAVLDLLTTEA